jgi:hypothetical protein
MSFFFFSLSSLLSLYLEFVILAYTQPHHSSLLPPTNALTSRRRPTKHLVSYGALVSGSAFSSSPRTFPFSTFAVLWRTTCVRCQCNKKSAEQYPYGAYKQKPLSFFLSSSPPTLFFGIPQLLTSSAIYARRGFHMFHRFRWESQRESETGQNSDVCSDVVCCGSALSIVTVALRCCQQQQHYSRC